jgi:ATP-dependent DNA ligase
VGGTAEGVVLKRLRSIYLPGRRSPGWRKIKTPGWAAVPSAEVAGS